MTLKDTRCYEGGPPKGKMSKKYGVNSMDQLSTAAVDQHTDLDIGEDVSSMIRRYSRWDEIASFSVNFEVFFERI